MIETNGGTKSLVVSGASLGAVPTPKQDFFVPTTYWIHSTRCCRQSKRYHDRGGLRARANADMLWPLDEVYPVRSSARRGLSARRGVYPIRRRGLTRHVGLFKEKDVEKHRGPTLARA